MQKARMALLWVTPEKYERFVAVCDDRMPPDHQGWKQTIEKRLAARGIPLGRLERFLIDPDEMAAWCRLHSGKVDSQSRSEYVAFLAAQRESE